ncbi:hypothetical protein [Lentzea sp. E54]|uniref:hypothetical protein n=1 Tax=Lentzea xerophila TaxID=3435883 RepID=UPI003DA5C3D3
MVDNTHVIGHTGGAGRGGLMEPTIGAADRGRQNVPDAAGKRHPIQKAGSVNSVVRIAGLNSSRDGADHGLQVRQGFDVVVAERQSVRTSTA